MNLPGMNLEAVVRPERLPAAPSEVTVLDVRYAMGRTDGREQYLAGHVPGAVFVDLEADLCDPVGDGTRGRHPLPGRDRFEAAMRRAGVRNDRGVVVYDDWDGSAATRAWWLLTYHGHPDVRVLDGGWRGHLDAGGATEREDVVPAPGDFTADPGHLPVVDAAGAARVAREGVLVDVRDPRRYRGEEEPIDPVAGHIPGAVNIPYKIHLGPQREEHRDFRVFDDLGTHLHLGGVRVEDEVAVYCGSGGTATHIVFALHRLGKTAALYPGSWSEWVSDRSRPVETGGTTPPVLEHWGGRR
jgi:thiosulfate/3-mercaptopyruvate sulfurtransferase